MKQVLQAWYERLYKYLINQGFQKGSTARNLYFKIDSGKILIFVVYVDDIIVGGNEGMCRKLGNEMQKEFEMSMIGELNLFLGLEVNQNDKVIFISQSMYIKELLKRLGGKTPNRCVHL